jgi:hypothetical protein
MLVQVPGKLPQRHLGQAWVGLDNGLQERAVVVVPQRSDR